MAIDPEPCAAGDVVSTAEDPAVGIEHTRRRRRTREDLVPIRSHDHGMTGKCANVDGERAHRGYAV